MRLIKSKCNAIRVRSLIDNS